jgi:hypothetical protein
MVCKPASNVMATKGTPRHTLADSVAKRAFQGEPESRCRCLSIPF